MTKLPPPDASNARRDAESASRLRLIGYVRVSTSRQAREGVSLAAQEERIRAYAAFVGCHVVRIEVDSGWSGKRSDRPALNRAVDAVLDGEADALIVYAIDRLARSSLDFLQVVERLSTADRGFVSCREQLDSTTPHGRFTLTILAALAQMEGELISARSLEAKARCRAEGRPVNGRTYGYTRRRGDTHLREVAFEMEVVDRILAWRDADKKVSYHKIAERLNTADIPAPLGGKWAKASVLSVERTHRRLREQRGQE